MRMLCNGSVTEFHWECERGDMDRAKAVLDLLHLDDDGVRSFSSILGLVSSYTRSLSFYSRSLFPSILGFVSFHMLMLRLFAFYTRSLTV